MLTVFVATFRELGPPDLCHVVKSTGKTGTRDVSARTASFLCIAYDDGALVWFIPLRVRCRRLLICLPCCIHQLTHIRHRRSWYMVRERQRMESSQRVLLVRLLSPSMPAESDTTPRLSCFNAFSRVDIRVDVKIPGGVNAYVIDLRGERCAYSSVNPLLLIIIVADMKLRQKYGRRPTCPLYCEPYYIRTTRHTSLTPIESWIQSLA